MLKTLLAHEISLEVRIITIFIFVDSYSFIIIVFVVDIDRYQIILVIFNSVGRSGDLAVSIA